MALALSGDKEVGECRDERQAIAAHEIPFLQTSKLLCTVLVVEGEQNVQSHGKGPVGISRHEPRGSQMMSLQVLAGAIAYIWIKKAWNWQKEDLPISGPAIDNSFHLRVLGEYADEGSKLERRNLDKIETVTKKKS